MEKKNSFLKAVSMFSDCRTENGAISNSSTGSELIDQFAVSGNFRNRELDVVFGEHGIIPHFEVE